MKTVWGLLLIIVCSAMSSHAEQAEEWTPFFGVSLMPNINAVLTEFDTTRSRKANKILIASTNFSLMVKAGVEKDQWSLLAHYYTTAMQGFWSEVTYATTNQEGPRYQSTYELREWKEFYIACGARYSPVLPEMAKSKLYFGGGIGFGRVAYKDHYSINEIDGLIQRTIWRQEIKAESEYYFKPYAEVGISTRVSRNVSMVFAVNGQYAVVPLDQNKLNPNIDNITHHWTAALEFGILYYIR